MSRKDFIAGYIASSKTAESELWEHFHGSARPKPMRFEDIDGVQCTIRWDTDYGIGSVSQNGITILDGLEDYDFEQMLIDIDRYGLEYVCRQYGFSLDDAIANGKSSRRDAYSTYHGRIGRRRSVMKNISSDRMIGEKDFDSVIDSATLMMERYDNGLQPDIRAEIAVEEAAADMGLIMDDDTVAKLRDMVIDKVYAGRSDFIAGYLAASLPHGIDKTM